MNQSDVQAGCAAASYRTTFVKLESLSLYKLLLQTISISLYTTTYFLVIIAGSIKIIQVSRNIELIFRYSIVINDYREQRGPEMHTFFFNSQYNARENGNWSHI